jgi:uncharacterized protein (DUF2062 family)
MPRRFFKRLSRQRHSIKDRWFMRPFQAVLHHSAYWSLNRRSVTRAVALGMFVAFIPLPVQMPLAAALALAFKVNVPVAIASVFITNPLTTVPVFYAAYRVGCMMLGLAPHGFHFEMTWAWLQTGLLPIWKPFLLGCLVLGIVAAVVSYVMLAGIWHLSLVLKFHERKREAAERLTAWRRKRSAEAVARKSNDSTM